MNYISYYNNKSKDCIICFGTINTNRKLKKDVLNLAFNIFYLFSFSQLNFKYLEV
jgi:hypothetical protein